jgi:cobalamin biosynthesis protein CobT
MNMTQTTDTIKTQVVAKYRGTVIGYYDNAIEAQAAIDKARLTEQVEDAQYETRMRRSLGIR